MSRSATVSREVWEAKGEELFGTNKEGWRFQCPACGYVCSIDLARQSHADIPRALILTLEACIEDGLPTVDARQAVTSTANRLSDICATIDALAHRRDKTHTP